MTDILKLGILSVSIVLVAIQFKAIKPEYGLYMTIAVAVIIMTYSFTLIENIIYGIYKLQDYLHMGDYMPVLLKITGISYISEFASDICRDTGYGAIANQIQIFGKLSVLIVSLPIFEILCKTVSGLLG
ncbi:MAG: stage III sporulation AC/AD family protein [Lachnospiraceae bacterium]|nr:stage III sporulation AC/AD family protein [Lachnospiraceae bacterium]